MSIGVIRGAITLKKILKKIFSEYYNSLQEIINRNNLKIEDIISIIFTATEDIDAAYPAVAARNLNITHAGLMFSRNEREK